MIDTAPYVSGDAAEDDGDGDGDQRGGEADEDGFTAAEDELGEGVLALVVGAEPVLGADGAPDRGDVGGVVCPRGGGR